MKISLNEIKRAFDDLIRGEKSRKQLSDWAEKLQSAADEEKIEYDPQSEEDRIWDGIEYLLGVDLLDIDGSYLHSIENFIDYKNKKIF